MHHMWIVCCSFPCRSNYYGSCRKQTGEEHLYREEKYAATYEINMLRCIFCGLCEEACPKDAIYLTETFAPSNYHRKGFIYGKEDLLIPHPKEDPEGYKKALGIRVTVHLDKEKKES